MNLFLKKKLLQKIRIWDGKHRSRIYLFHICILPCFFPSLSFSFLLSSQLDNVPFILYIIFSFLIVLFSRSSSCHRYEEPAKETQFIPEKKYHLESFSRIVPYQSTHMGYYATAIIKDVLTTQRAPVQNTEKKYVLKRLFKSSVCKRMNVKSVLDEAKILELINSVFITRLLGKFQTTDELVFVYEWTPTGDLWNVLHEDEELRDTNGFLSLDITRFYAANIILALEHLHERKIAYRNLKPENILLDATGYIKISCMSFAKVRAVHIVLTEIYFYF